MKLFEEAMKHGFVRATDRTVLFIGFAGNGKTCSMFLMQNKPPPLKRTSTPCAKTPIRTVATSRAEKRETKQGIEWHPVKKSDLSQMVVERSVALQQDPSTEKDEQPNHKVPQASTSQSTQHSPKAQKSRLPATVVSRRDIRHKFARKMDRIVITKPKKEVDYIHMVDSGGQPQFQEALPTFINEAAACFLVVKLCDCLDDHPMVEMYQDDKLLSSYRSPLSHRQMLQYCIRTVQSQTSRGKEPPLIAFLGTHKDLEHLCTTESRADKNRKIEEMLPADKSNFLYITTKDLIAGFDAKTPSVADKELAGKVRRWVTERSHAKAIDIPLQYYGLEEVLQDMVEEKERGVFSKEECRAVGEKLFFNDDSFDEALVYLAHLKVILYYKSILPDVVFCSSQALLDKVSELVSFYYECSTDDVTDGIEKKFREQALVTLKLLKKERFSSHYIEGLFGPEELIKLLENEELLLLAKVSDQEYLLPCALPTVDCHALVGHPSSSVPPLLVFFPHGGPQLGVFCRLVAYLLKIGKWKLLMEKETPVEITRNSVAFALPGSVPGRVTICDPLLSFFMISVSSEYSDLLQGVCPCIRATILNGIHHVTRMLKYTNSVAQDAFLCSAEGCTSPHPTAAAPSRSVRSTILHGIRKMFKRSSAKSGEGSSADAEEGKCSPHAAIIDAERRFKTCTVNPAKGNRVTEEELVWFSNTTSSLDIAHDTTLKELPIARILTSQPPALDATQKHESLVHTPVPSQPPAVDPTPEEQPTAHTPATPQSDKPNMMELTRFPGTTRKIDIAEQIGTQYYDVGITLLNDYSGAVISGIVEKCRGDPLQINREILSRWIQGKGMEDRSWQGLIGVLRNSGLTALAEDIEEVKAT